MISVLISVYKSEQPSHLSQALQSIWFEQTYKPSEIILVEDGQLGDDLKYIIQQWKHQLNEKLIIIRNETNIGLTKSLNRGIPYAKSKYIARMDSDDISLPNRFELQVRFLESHPDIDIIGGAIREFYGEQTNENVRYYPRDNEEVIKSIHKASPLAHPAVMMRKALFENGLRYDERYRTCQDLALWFDVLASHKKIANLSDSILLFRREPEVLHRRKNYQNIKNEFRIYTKGIYRLNGLFTFKYIFPFARFIFRLLPISWVETIYNSRFRKALIEKK